MIKEEKLQIKIFKNKNFRLFYSGSVISTIGSLFVQFATGLFILDLTGKAIYMSIYLALSSLLFIVLQPILGAVTDRLNKVKVLYTIDYIFGISDIVLAIVLFLTNNTSVILLAMLINASINASMAAMYQPTYNSMLPLIVEDEELSPAYSLMSTLGNLQNIIGILLASVIYMVFGYKLLLIINGISFIVAAIMEMFIKIEHESKSFEGGLKKLLSDVKEGYTYMVSKKELINMAKVAVMMNFFLVGVFVITLPYMINTELNLLPYVLATFNVSMSVGGIAMAIYISKKEINKAGDKIVKGFFIGVLCFVLITFNYYLFNSEISTLLVFIICMSLTLFVFGASGSYIQIPLNISYAKRIDKEMLGRVMAFRSTLSSLASPLAMLIFGLLVDNTGVLLTLIIGCFGILGATLFAYTNKYIKML